MVEERRPSQPAEAIKKSRRLQEDKTKTQYTPPKPASVHAILWYFGPPLSFPGPGPGMGTSKLLSFSETSACNLNKLSGSSGKFTNLPTSSGANITECPTWLTNCTEPAASSVAWKTAAAAAARIGLASSEGGCPWASWGGGCPWAA